jgi:hypothetical protein
VPSCDPYACAGWLAVSDTLALEHTTQHGLQIAKDALAQVRSLLTRNQVPDDAKVVEEFSADIDDKATAAEDQLRKVIARCRQSSIRLSNQYDASGVAIRKARGAYAVVQTGIRDLNRSPAALDDGGRVATAWGQLKDVSSHISAMLDDYEHRREGLIGLVDQLTVRESEFREQLTRVMERGLAAAEEDDEEQDEEEGDEDMQEGEEGDEDMQEGEEGDKDMEEGDEEKTDEEDGDEDMQGVEVQETKGKPRRRSPVVLTT